jgi:hypothetical protein
MTQTRDTNLLSPAGVEMSLLQRLGGPQNPAQNAPPPPAGNVAAQAQNAQNNQQRPGLPGRNQPQRPANNPFANANANPPQNNQRLWTIQPAYKTVVRFELRGLGDPFFRLMGDALNAEYGDHRALTRALEAGGEPVEKLVTLLDESWIRFDLQGAVLIYNWNAESWRAIAFPDQPAPQNAQGDADDFTDDSNASPAPKALFHCLRALDLGLVMNVLGRSRSQLLIAHAPLLLAQQYMNRSIMTDDPRLVALVRATGYIEEG